MCGGVLAQISSALGFKRLGVHDCIIAYDPTHPSKTPRQCIDDAAWPMYAFMEGVLTTRRHACVLCVLCVLGVLCVVFSLLPPMAEAVPAGGAQGLFRVRREAGGSERQGQNLIPCSTINHPSVQLLWLPTQQKGGTTACPPAAGVINQNFTDSCRRYVERNQGFCHEPPAYRDPGAAPPLMQVQNAHGGGHGEGALNGASSPADIHGEAAVATGRLSP